MLCNRRHLAWLPPSCIITAILCVPGNRGRRRTQRVAGAEGGGWRHARVSLRSSTALPADSQLDLRREELNHYLPAPHRNDAGLLQGLVPTKEEQSDDTSATCRQSHSNSCVSIKFREAFVTHVPCSDTFSVFPMTSFETVGKIASHT